MKESFPVNYRLTKNNLEMLDIVNGILDDLQAQGYTLTLRQLYYQLVAKGIIPNRQSEYSKLSTLLVKGRMCGVVDWNAIEDRVRRPQLPYWVFDVEMAIDDTIKSYRLNRQSGQQHYIEVWCEKDALSGILSRVTSHYHIRLMINRGYSSASAMYRAYKRFLMYQEDLKDLVILYLGDHDPSGLDMIRDVDDRLRTFGVLVDVVHIALTMEQIEKYNPPPNPTKITDPRAEWYLNEYGNTSWEVDALSPQILTELLKKEINYYVDEDMFNDVIKQEEEDKIELKEFVK